MVSAWVNENNLALGQVATEEKSNEITAVPKLLDLIDVSGDTITVDAMGCQKETWESGVEKGHGRIEQRRIRTAVDTGFLKRQLPEKPEHTEESRVIAASGR
jgi:predicted transposase YbfD/YdcC